MEKQGLRRYLGFGLGVVLLSLWVGVSGCSGTISGQIYFDANKNSTLDSNEIGVPFAKLTVIKDGKTMKEGFTDAEGNFRFKHGGEGTYYLKIDTSLLEEMGAADYSAPIEQEEEDGPSAQVFKAIDMDDGEDTSGAAGGTGLEGDDDDDSSTSNTGSKPAALPSEHTSSGYRVSVENIVEKKHEMIPVWYDRLAALSRLPERVEQKCICGAPCTLKIPYPAQCSLEPLYVGQGISLDGGANAAWDSTFNVVTFLEGSNVSAQRIGAKAQSTDSSGSTVPTVASNELAMAEIDIVSECTEEEERTFEPKIKCGDEIIDGGSIPVKFEYEVKAELGFSILGDASVGRGNIEFKLIVYNTGLNTIKRGKVKLELPALCTMNIISSDSSAACQDRRGSMVCIVENLAGESDVTFRGSFDMPTQLSSSTEFEMKATFEAEGLEDDIEEESSWYIEAVPEEGT